MLGDKIMEQSCPSRDQHTEDKDIKDGSKSVQLKDVQFYEGMEQSQSSSDGNCETRNQGTEDKEVKSESNRVQKDDAQFKKKNEQSKSSSEGCKETGCQQNDSGLAFSSEDCPIRQEGRTEAPNETGTQIEGATNEISPFKNNISNDVPSQNVAKGNDSITSCKHVDKRRDGLVNLGQNEISPSKNTTSNLPSPKVDKRKDSMKSLCEPVGKGRDGSAPPCQDRGAEKDIHRTGAKCVAGGVQDKMAAKSGYHEVGAFRTKPGRGERTLSMSCSDKMARWNIVGCQGALLSHFIYDPVYFSAVIIGRWVHNRNIITNQFWGCHHFNSDWYFNCIFL